MKSTKRLLSPVVYIARFTVSQLCIFVLFFVPLPVNASDAQSILDKKVTLNVKNETLQNVVSLIKKQTDINISFSAKTIKSNGSITITVNDKKLEDVLGQEFAALDIDYRLVNDQIVLFQKSNPNKSLLNNNALLIGATTNKVAADIVITGTITNEKKEPIGGVTITEKGTKNSVITKDDGSFKINVKNSSAILVTNYIGYSSNEVAIKDQIVLNISLVSVSSSLDEVVVVGYGTQKKVTTTGAVASIGTKELVQSPVANISNSLVGRLPGLFATQGGGEPGNDASRIRIRGIGTFSGNTDPLTLVDGVQVDNFNNIDPNEIESVTILKDAASTAIYGIRGANGVLLVTTKRGKTGPPRISYTFNQALNSFTDLRNMMNSGDYADNFNRAIRNDAYVTGNVYLPRYSETDIQKYRDGSDPIFFPNKDWAAELFRNNAPQSQQNISVSGGQKKVKYFVSAGLFRQQGQFVDTKNIVDDYSAQSVFNRYNLRSNFNFELTDKLKMALDIAVQTETRSGNNGTSTERVVGDVFRASPLSTPGVVDGRLVQIFTGSQNNPYISLLFPNLAGGTRRSYRNYLNGSLRFDYDLSSITKGLSARSMVAIQTYNDQQITNSKTAIVYQAVRLPDGTINYVPSTTEAVFGFGQSGTYNRRITAEAGLDYKRSFGLHNVGGLLLYNQQKTFSPALQFLVPSGLQQFVGRVTYDFAGRYLFGLDVGYNGTENFALGKRFGVFPAISGGWVVSNEKFFPKRGLVDFLKIRGSYGEVGNDNIGGNRFLYRPTSYGTVDRIYFFGQVGSSYGAQTGIREGATGNPDITWERSIKRNIGVEMKMLENRISFTGDFFDENRSNILAIPQTISAVSGLSQPATNLGVMQNKGYEFDLSYADNIGEFNYRLSANYSFAKNKVLFRDEITPLNEYQRRTGQRFGQFFGLLVDGMYNTWDEVNDAKRPVNSYVANNRVQPGDLIFRDVNGDGIINDFDQAPIGYSNVPEETYGISLSASYKGFDISVLFQGVGNVSHYYTRFQRGTGFSQAPPEGAPAYFNESWTQERYDAGLPIQFPRWSVNATPNNATSAFWLADASFVRLKNMEIGYSPKANFLKKVGIRTCRIYANANNLFTWKKMYPGIDPENVSTGDTNTEPYPLVRTINFGFNLNF